MAQTPDVKKHTGGCHCGKVRFETPLPPDAALSCNCSICSRKGTLLKFVSGSDFKLLQGQDALTDYQWGKKKIHHLFCSTCGVTSFARGAAPDGSAVYAVNVRCIDDVDLDTVPLKKFDGKSL